jgi:hypothetical protein
MLEARGSSTLLSIVNWVTCLREYCLTLSVFMGEEPQVCAKLPLSSQGNQHSNSWKRSRNVRNRRVKHLVSQGEVTYFFKGIMPTTHCVHGWGKPPLCKITPLKGIGRSTVELVRESLMLEREGSTTLFSIVNWVSWKKENCLPLSVFMGECLQLCAKSPLSSDWIQRCICCKRSRNVTSRREKQLVFRWVLSNLFQGILLTT